MFGRDPLEEQKETQIPAGRDSHIRGKRVWLGLFLGSVIAVLMAGNILYGIFLHTRNERPYCLSCHEYMGPASMWEISDRHTEGFSCPLCHSVLPDQQARCGAFSAHPETVNPNCMGCHSNVMEQKPLDKVVEVRFASPHGPGQREVSVRWQLNDLMFRWHLKKKVCLCTDCHRNVSHDKGASSSDHQPKMAYCKECHYHAAKDDYVRVSPLPKIQVREAKTADGNY